MCLARYRDPRALLVLSGQLIPDCERAGVVPTAPYWYTVPKRDIKPSFFRLPDCGDALISNAHVHQSSGTIIELDPQVIGVPCLDFQEASDARGGFSLEHMVNDSIHEAIYHPIEHVHDSVRDWRVMVRCIRPPTPLRDSGAFVEAVEVDQFHVRAAVGCFGEIEG